MRISGLRTFAKKMQYSYNFGILHTANGIIR